ncbi:hypothetical protein COLO4_25806 [Corchorus olitorius]|uniref:Uncharacterized protein n=1 Tax=Corchorus olitorius TaxID=93759 RepID=A0A1R3I022_9ROSI|nr:hypothetical protein COLO4_25806 [Corchorus olitorius]
MSTFIDIGLGFVCAQKGIIRILLHAFVYSIVALLLYFVDSYYEKLHLDEAIEEAKKKEQAAKGTQTQTQLTQTPSRSIHSQPSNLPEEAVIDPLKRGK